MLNIKSVKIVLLGVSRILLSLLPNFAGRHLYSMVLTFIFRFITNFSIFFKFELYT